MEKALILALLSISILINVSAAGISQKEANIVVGPNILVSRDGDMPHHELIITANPKDPKNLLGAAITHTRPDGGPACKTYASYDGGYTWTDMSFRDQQEFGGADPQVAFGFQGTGYFVALTTGQGTFVYRSEDGGNSWQKTVNIGFLDHPQIVVDKSYGKYAGRIYISALHIIDAKAAVGVFRSDDDGRTFIGPVLAANGGDGRIALNHNLLILADGTLLVPYCVREKSPEKWKTNPNRPFWFVTSSDGGISFSSPTKIHDQYTNLTELAKNRTGTNRNALGGKVTEPTSPVFAADSQGKYRDRIYVAWIDDRRGRSRILFSYSRDRGKTWTEQKPISVDVPSDAYQYQPMMTVNYKGILGVQWFDTHESKNQDHYDLYFTASVDGGESFLPPARVSTESSIPGGPGNLVPLPETAVFRKTDESARFVFTSAFLSNSNGGDYMGLIADADGIFHPFWADSRSGTFQVWTSRIRVITPVNGNGWSERNTHIKKIEVALSGEVRSE